MEMLATLDTVPHFIAYFVTSCALFAVFLFVYLKVTPHDEIALIKSGNTAAGVSLAGAVFGFLLPLSTVVRVSESLVDVALWGLVALVVQILVFFVCRLLVSGLSSAIEQGNVSVGVLVGSFSSGIGTLNAACMTP